MGMTINTNMSALTAYRNLSTTQNGMSKSLEKLSSGLRINRASDDAAGLAISEGLKSQVGGLTVAARNAQDGISVAQTAEGSLGQAQSILQRMRDLAVQAGNDSNNAASRSAITQEAGKLTQELGRMATATTFNGIHLLDGSKSALSFQVGANGSGDNQISVDLTGANVKGIAASLGAGGAGSSFGVITPTAVTGLQQFTITNPDATTSAVSVTLGAANTYNTVQDVADAMNGSSSFNGLAHASVDANNKLVVSANNGGTVVGAGAGAVAGTGIGTATAIAGSTLDFSSATGAAAAITTIDAKITAISTARASLGADQNRLEYTITNLNISKENLTASRSQITDTDMASEMVNFTRDSILSQAGTAMLAQANQSNSGVLKLLG